MKRTRRFLVMILCTFALLGTVGCGNNSADNAADQTMQDKNGTNRKENGNVNDATAGNGNGVMDDAVDDVTDGVEDGCTADYFRNVFPALSCHFIQPPLP